MAQPNKGTLFTLFKTRDGRWQAQIVLAHGTPHLLPPFPKGASEAVAREKAAHWAKKYAVVDAEAARQRFRRELARGPKVISDPTASGYKPSGRLSKRSGASCTL